MISNEPRWDIVSLDHDLNFEEFVDSNRKDCGMEVVRWIERNAFLLYENKIIPKQIIVHTSNKIAGTEMVLRLEDLRRDPWNYHPSYCTYERFEYD
jgi:hypothetical protein